VSLLFRSAEPGPGMPFVPMRSPHSMISVTGQTARRHSAVWAALRLRADLISSLPIDAFRHTTSGIQEPMPLPPVLRNPTPYMRMMEWVYSSQQDLDTYGNCFGLISNVDGGLFPRFITLVPASEVTVVQKPDGDVRYRIKGREYDRSEVWHEKQYTVPGMAVGLSPIAYAALAISQYVSAQQFAVAWYTQNAIPAGILRNSAKTIKAEEALEAKARFKASVAQGDVFVTGVDWEFSPLQSKSNDAAFLNSMNASAADIARFFSVPVDMIDASQAGTSVTYANITQRNLQLLILHLGPMISRREDAISASLMSGPRFVKFNTDALLRMDPQTRSAMMGQQVRDRLRAPDELRQLDNFEPFTEDQYAQIDRLFTTRRVTVTTPATPVETEGLVDGIES